MANKKIDELSIKEIELIIEKLDKKKDYITSFLYTYYMYTETSTSAFINNLAWYYEDGLGVKLDKPKAMNLYKRAIEKGSTQALVNLAVYYYEGNVVKKDFNKAYDLLCKAYKKKNKLKTLEKIIKVLNLDVLNLLKLDEKIKWQKLYLNTIKNENNTTNSNS